MPRVSTAYRATRRHEIATAAVRCLERQGVRETSIADIVRESGLSTGAIYSHFSNKGELARYVVGHYLGVRIDELEAAGRRGIVSTPQELLTALLRNFEDHGLSPALVVQFWGESTVDPDLRSEVIRTIALLRAGLIEAVRPWAVRQAAARQGAADPEAICVTASDAITALAQGYIARSALLGLLDVDQYVTSVATVACL